MIAEIIVENLATYVQLYNFKRPHLALQGYTPACAWITGSKERFDVFAKNSRKKNKTKLFKEIENMFDMNDLKHTSHE